VVLAELASLADKLTQEFKKYKMNNQLVATGTAVPACWHTPAGKARGTVPAAPPHKQGTATASLHSSCGLVAAALDAWLKSNGWWQFLEKKFKQKQHSKQQSTGCCSAIFADSGRGGF